MINVHSLKTRTNCPKEQSNEQKVRDRQIDNRTIRQTNKHAERRTDKIITKMYNMTPLQFSNKRIQIMS